MSNDTTSLLNTIQTGFDKNIPVSQEEKQFSLLEETGISTTFKTGFEDSKPINYRRKKPKYKIESSVISSMQTGFDGQIIEKDDKPKEIETQAIDLQTSIDLGFDKIQPPAPIKNTIDINRILKSYNKNSILNDIDSGFSLCNTIFIDKRKKKKSKVCLFKENYLSEFKSPTEKALARFNLGVYSKEEIDNKIEKIIINSDNFVTKIELNNKLANLDFVDSKLKSYIDYQIPVNLFKL